jgi:hypothetical protein
MPLPVNPPPIPPRVTFSWSPVSVPATITIGGNTYPYSTQADGVSRPSTDARYAANTTPTNTLLTFTASAEAFNANIVRYHWDFGDGTESFGPTVSKTYIVPNPTQRVAIQVLDSNGLSSTAVQTLNLVLSAPVRAKFFRS